MMKAKNKHPDEIAHDAAKASEAGDHREAERLYLIAAARASAYTNNTSMVKFATKWDRCAARERRLAELAKARTSDGETWLWPHEGQTK